MSTFVDPQPGYWKDYGPFQQVKHQLIRTYLEGWFPKLGFRCGRIMYLDTHAGRGGYTGDHPGSPIVALRTLLEHSARERLLANSEFRFVFLEKDAQNALELRKEVEGIETHPRILVEVKCGDAFRVLRREVGALKSAGLQMAPAFLFVDPYGFGLPGDVLAEVMEFKRVELFVNVMWRELDMAIRQEPQDGHELARILDRLFGHGSWRSIHGETMVDRADQAAELLATRVGAKCWTHVRMVTGGGAVRFFLLHLTNHDAGRDLMKDCVWKVCPDGSMSVRRSDDPNQFVLIEPEPDLAPLRDWLLMRLLSGPVSTGTLKKELRSTIWRWKHLGDVEAELKERGRVERRRGLLRLLPNQDRLF